MLTKRPKPVRTLTIHNIRTQFLIADRSTANGPAGRRFMRRGDEMVELSADTLPRDCYAAIPSKSIFDTTPQEWVPFVNACLTARLFTKVVR